MQRHRVEKDMIIVCHQNNVVLTRMESGYAETALQMIDRDEDYYTVDMLHMWKQLAELEASKNIMGRGIL